MPDILREKNCKRGIVLEKYLSGSGGVGNSLKLLFLDRNLDKSDAAPDYKNMPGRVAVLYIISETSQ